MEPTEALALLAAATNLTLAIERFIMIAEDLYPHLHHRTPKPANQSGGPPGPIHDAERRYLVD